MLYGKTWVNNHAHVLKGSNGINNKYVCYYLNQIDYHGYVNGATRLKLTQANMRKLPFLLAPLNEQIRIANKLDSLLGKVEAAQTRLDKIPTLLKRFRQAVLAAATSGELTKAWRGSTNYIDISAKYFAPLCWHHYELNDLVSLVTSGSRGWAKYYSDKGATFIRAQNINSDRIDLGEVAFVDLPKQAEGRRTQVQENDLLVTITGANVTKSTRVQVNLGEAYVSQHVALIRLRDKNISRFIELYLWAENSGRGQLLDLAYGGGKPGLNLSSIKELLIALPPIEEQKQIVHQVESLFALADKVEKQYQQARLRTDKLTQSLLAKAFKGELVPQDPNDESAEKLLARIQTEREKLKPAKKRVTVRLSRN